jgi:hypothetical protein
MSSLQVDSISSMGGGHVDGAGKVISYAVKKVVSDSVTTTSTTLISMASNGFTIDITPKYPTTSIIMIRAKMAAYSASGSQPFYNITNASGNYLSNEASGLGIAPVRGDSVGFAMGGIASIVGYETGYASTGARTYTIVGASAGGGNVYLHQNNNQVILEAWELVT